MSKKCWSPIVSEFTDRCKCGQVVTYKVSALVNAPHERLEELTILLDKIEVTNDRPPSYRLWDKIKSLFE